MAYDTYIFDMDGTLVDSMPDLVTLTNKALVSVGYPEREFDEIRSFVGNGAQRLVYLAAPADADPDILDHVLQTWKQMYPVYGFMKTQPFPGVPELIDTLRSYGMNTGVLSNKFNKAVHDIADHYFPGKFDAVVGEDQRTPRKPDPTGLLRMIAELGSTPERTVYVGDTLPDVMVAKNAGVACVLCSWGYETPSFYENASVDAVVSSAEELLAFVESYK